MSPAASNGRVGVRFSRGEAFMLSGGDRGAIMLLPMRYNRTSQKTLFIVSGHNRTGAPINFGTENVSITIDKGDAMPIYDFDRIRHGYKVEANQLRMLALVDAAANTYMAYRTGRHDQNRGRYMLSQTAEGYEDRLHSIAENLAEKVRSAKSALQTTTIDPGSYWAGWIVADQPSLADGEVRRMAVSVSFAGETHSFNLFLAPEGTPTPPQIDLPAVTLSNAEGTLYGTPKTWLWDAPPPLPEGEQSSYTVTVPTP